MSSLNKYLFYQKICYPFEPWYSKDIQLFCKLFYYIKLYKNSLYIKIKNDDYLVWKCSDSLRVLSKNSANESDIEAMKKIFNS